ncbi:MAG: beta strand repeat-containing protein, partial [Bacteroidota bacterium]
FTTGNYGRGAEWSASSGAVGTTAGYPNDVQIGNTTTLNYPNSGTGAFSTTYTVGRDLTIDAGSNFYMDYGGSGNKSGGLNVVRDIIIAGNLSLGNAVGGDLSVGRDWTHTTGTFTDNSRTVTFNGATGDQTITPASGESFSFLTINKATSGGVIISGAITVTGTLTLTKGNLTIGNNDLTLTSSTALSSQGSSTSYIVTNGTGLVKQTISGSGTYRFPVGSASVYNPATITWAAAPGVTRLDARYIASTASTTGLPVTLGNCLSVTDLLNNGYWSFTNTGTPSSNFDINFTRNGHDNAATNLNDHGIVRRANSGSSWATAGTWSDPGSTAISPASTGQVALSQTGNGSFGEFAIAKGSRDLHTITLTSANNIQTVCPNASLVNITYTLAGGANSASVTGLPSGVTSGVSGGVLTISGTPTVSGTYNYTVNTLGNSCGAAQATGTITVSNVFTFGNLQFPSSGSICSGGSLDIYGQVFASGVTNASSTAAGAGVEAQFGYNTTNND